MFMAVSFIRLSNVLLNVSDNALIRLLFQMYIAIYLLVVLNTNGIFISIL